IARRSRCCPTEERSIGATSNSSRSRLYGIWQNSKCQKFKRSMEHVEDVIQR
ncbi:hypothetical protein S245_053740, partial [Arachis hypogaea]